MTTKVHIVNFGPDVVSVTKSGVNSDQPSETIYPQGTGEAMSAEITVDFYRKLSDTGLGATVAAFTIPDSAQILSRDPEEFMRWCYEQMMSIGKDAKRTGSTIALREKP